MTPSRSSARRWLLVADFCAILLALAMSEETGWVRGGVNRPALLLAAGCYLMVTAAAVYFFARADGPTQQQQSAETHGGKALLGRKGPAYLAYFPRFVMGAALAGYGIYIQR